MKMNLANVKIPRVKIPVKVSRFLGMTKLKVQKHSPEILLVSGLGGFVGTVILACKATTKLPGVVASHEDMMDDIHEMEDQYAISVIESEEGDDTPVYITKDIQKAKVKAYVTIAKDYICLYGPSVSLGLASGACFIGSYGIEKKRYTGALAAYNGAMTAFEVYRQRVCEELGDEADQRFRYGWKKEKLEGEVVDEKGKKKKTKEDILTLDAGEPSQYARVFEHYIRDGIPNPNWYDDPYFNMQFLKCQENYFNMLLNTRGYVYLNEVYDHLGFPLTSEGQLVGWMKRGADEPTNYISFGLYDITNPQTRRFINQQENAILLDFNVDGVIIDLV